ncbi:MAG: hypothetical protein ACK559_04460, partial [bacterium]
LRQIAHVRVALLDEPELMTGDLGGPVPQLPGRNRPQLPGAAEHRQRAGRVVGRRHREVVAQRVHLVVRARAGVEPPVEVGEALHGDGISGAFPATSPASWR